MLDHVFLTVSDMQRSVVFYKNALAPLGIDQHFDYDGKNGPPGHPDLKGFGKGGRLYLWLREGAADSRAVHLGFVASSRKQVDAAHAAAIAAGATDNGAPGIRLYYDPRYYAANALGRAAVSILRIPDFYPTR